MTTILLLHAAATLALTGLIWFVQLVHYPLFLFAGDRTFSEFAVSHQYRTSWVVVPLMLVELATALTIFFQAEAGSAIPAIAGLLLLMAIWLSTFLVQVPIHRRLELGFDRHSAQELVRTNWFRTAAWSARALVAIKLLTP